MDRDDARYLVRRAVGNILMNIKEFGALKVAARRTEENSEDLRQRTAVRINSRYLAHCELRGS